MLTEKIVYFDEKYPGAWIDNEWSKKIVNHLKDSSFEEKNAEDLKIFINNSFGKNTEKSVIVFSKDMVPDTLFSGMNSPDDLIGRYLYRGGRIVWIGHNPLCEKGKNKLHLGNGEKDREHIYQHGTHFAILGVESLIADSSSYSQWTNEWNKKMESRNTKMMSNWHSKRPINIEIGYSTEHLSLTVKPLKMEILAFADVTLMPCSLNIKVISRWKRSGKKIGSFGLDLMNFGGNMTLTEEFPKEFSLESQKLACAWHVIFNNNYQNQGFYRFWDCGVSYDEVPIELVADIITLATTE
jgi:hypothetical protein